MGWLIFGICVVAYWVIYSIYQVFKDKDMSQAELNRLSAQVKEITSAREDWGEWQKQIENNYEILQTEKKNLNELVKQRSKGFPLLGEVYKEYFDVKSRILEAYLRNKDHPADKAADLVKTSNKEKQDLIREVKALTYKIKNYELIAPFLTEAEDDITQEADAWILSDYSEEELEDEVTRFVTKEEYRKLGVSDRNQLALDRYWERRKKSSWIIGKMYERYVGYLYEKQGWQVEYFGITERYADLGRDLIARKGDIVHIVQCKNWSKYKRIYENHIFQLFGTTYEYQNQHPTLKVHPVFFTSTSLSDTADEFCKRLGIGIQQNKKLEPYPCIKCNINPSTKEKIYHLPFDQQYDKAKISMKGETYVQTVAEAEELGFRRAYRWKGEKTKV